jgi:hypothetical protein
MDFSTLENKPTAAVCYVNDPMHIYMRWLFSFVQCRFSAIDAQLYLPWQINSNPYENDISRVQNTSNTLRYQYDDVLQMVTHL